ncbi:Alpha/Beta hydrolase protein [Hypoxylon rubiginosum]|uniref:Alpha/Beta hydrolase protein n=1 Tax=Hypoxylon rubiginosum TaxID=110542 RepID=A0ACC0CNJ5_9PEZI|nr:Alpha/Beta hydrolase protein [Hypoxylon rubiginosum]
MSANFGVEPLASPSSASTKTIEETTGPTHQLFLPEPIAAPVDSNDDDNDETTSNDATSPLVICFHGSGESCSPSWDALIRSLVTGTTDAAAPHHRLRVLAFERGPDNPKPAQATADLLAYLQAGGDATRPPYVLVAHSYGGAFARTFLEEVDDDDKTHVAGMVLVETGQEGGLAAGLEERQYRRRVLGHRPLSVVRGNSLMGVEAQIAELEGREATTEVERQGLRGRREMLGVWDREDERLKRRQLQLSRRKAPKRYVHIPDCGHHVVRDRPDVVAAEVAWVVENMGKGDGMHDDAGEDEEEEEEESAEGGGSEAEKGDRGWEKIRRIWKGVVETLVGRLRGLR